MEIILLKRVLLVTLLLLILPRLAEAGDITDCEGNNPTVKITGCSRLIESGQLDGKALASAHNNRGVGFIRMGRNTLAIAEFDAAISINPKHYKALINRGSAYVENGQLDKALRDFNNAIEVNRDSARAYDRRGLVYFFKGEFKSALDDLNKAIGLSPGSALIYNNRGVVYEGMGLMTKAIADYRKALKLDPSLEIAKTNLRSLLGDAVSAGLGQSRSTHYADHPILVPLSTSDSVRFGLQTKPQH